MQSARVTPSPDLYADIANYYGAKVRRFGPTPLGVDWTSVPTQELRFVQLLKMIPRGAAFSIADVGCGYGALLNFMRRRFRGTGFAYFGVDVAAEMIAHALERNAGKPGTHFEVGHRPPPVDYAVASGIFNVKLYRSDDDWHNYIAATLGDMARASRKGFAVNFLAALPGGETGRQELYRVQPQVWRDHCRQTLDGDAEIIEGYGLAEFTLRVITPAR